MNTKNEKSEKSIGFTVKNFTKEQKPFVFQYFFEKRVVKSISNNGSGVRPALTRLDILWGTLTAKLFREKDKPMIAGTSYIQQSAERGA